MNISLSIAVEPYTLAVERVMKSLKTKMTQPIADDPFDDDDKDEGLKVEM